MSALYKRIEDLCEKNQVSVTTMCKESGASRASLSDLKMGRKQKLSADTLSKIAKYFNVTVDYLINGGFHDFETHINGIHVFSLGFSSAEEKLDNFELNDYRIVRQTSDMLVIAENESTASTSEIDSVIAFHMRSIPKAKEKAPAESGKRSVSDDDIKFALFRGREEITDAMYQEVLNFAEYVARREEEKKKKE